MNTKSTRTKTPIVRWLAGASPRSAAGIIKEAIERAWTGSATQASQPDAHWHMEWWTGMGSCGSGSVADMSQIEAGIFDPWINCDDLDLGSMLHQANVSNSSSSGTSSESSPVSAQTANTNQTQSVATGGSPASQSDNGSEQQTIGGATGQLQNYNFACQNNTDSSVLSQVSQQQLQQQQHHHQQQQQQQQHQQNLSPTARNVKQNFFNIISSASRSSNHHHHHPHLNNHNQQLQLHHQHHHQHQQQQHHHQQYHQHQHQQVSISVSNNHAPPPQTSISSSQCSSSVSSVDSSPLNNQVNGYLCSPTSSSPILIPANAVATVGHSLLMKDSSEDSKQILHQQALHHNHHHNYHQQQHQQQQQLQNSNNQQRSQITNNNSVSCGDGDDISDSKSNLECLLHLANGHPDQNRPIVQYEFALNNSHIDNNSHLLFTCPPQSSQSTAISTTSNATTPTTTATTKNSSMSNVTSSSPSNERQQQHPTGQIVGQKSKGYSAVGCSSAKPSSTTTSTTNTKSSSTTTSNSSSGGNKQVVGQKVRRCRHITDYVLADEEKRLLIKEGYTDFPMTCQSRPLSKTEERILRKIRRKIRNKKSAQCSRQRKKEYVEDLERKYAAIVRENEELRQVLDRLQEQRTIVQQTESGIPTITLDWKDLLLTPTTKQMNSSNVYNI